MARRRYTVWISAEAYRRAQLAAALDGKGYGLAERVAAKGGPEGTVAIRLDREPYLIAKAVARHTGATMREFIEQAIAEASADLVRRMLGGADLEADPGDD